MRIHVLPLIFLAAIPAAAIADTPAGSSAPANTPKRAVKQLKVTSTAFAANQAIPAEYTCEGSQLPPPLAWSGVPKDTRSIALLVEDPDAPNGAFTHWLVTGLPPTTMSLTPGTALPSGATAGKNGKGEAGYTGPCPPSGRHHYHFHVYALETTIPTPASKEDFQSAITGHALAEGDLVGVYEMKAAGDVSPAPTGPKK